MENYRLAKAEKVPSGNILHEVLTSGGVEEKFRYYSIRMGLTWPTIGSPGFFVVGGQEVQDQFDASERPLIRVIQEYEQNDLSLDGLFDSVTDAYSSNLCDQIYVDFTLEDFKLRFWEYLDRRGMRSVNVLDVPYKNILLRFGLVQDYNSSGDLLIDKGSKLFEDLKGISRSHLKDFPESKFYRVNGLSFLVAGFEKYKAQPRLVMKTSIDLRNGREGWML